MRRKTPFVLAAGIMLAGYAYAEKGYVIRDLGTFGGTSASVTAINDRGQMVVKVTGIGDTFCRGFIVDGERTSILPLDFSPSGITSRGDVVGTFVFPQEPDGSPFSDYYVVQVAVLFQNHAMTRLGVAEASTVRYGSALAANDQGQVAGWARHRNGSGGQPARPFLWQNGKGADLAPSLMDSLFPGSPAYATAINDFGLIVGYGIGQNSTPVGFYGANSVFVTLNADPEHPGKTLTAVNNRGTITGYTGLSSSCEPRRGFVVERGVYRLLPMTGTVQPRAINDSGVIAGTLSQSPTCSSTSAFVLDGTALTTLPQLPGGS
jgi:uncharacterized membrane protein